MKTSCLFFLLLLPFTVEAQGPFLRDLYADSLTMCWKSAERVEEAVKFANALYDAKNGIWTFNNKMHEDLALRLKQADAGSGEWLFLQRLYAEARPEIREKIAPLYYWGAIRFEKEEKKRNSLCAGFRKLLGDSADNNKQTELFGLLILQDLKQQGSPDTTWQRDVYQHIRKNLEACCATGQIHSLDYMKIEKRAWARQLLAYCYFTDYSAAPGSEALLLLAVKYSPDADDRMHATVPGRNNRLLRGADAAPGYAMDYYYFLQKNDRHAEALNVITEHTFIYATDANMQLLQKQYALLKNKKTFRSYWQEYIHAAGKSIPGNKIVQTDGTELHLENNSGKWTFIDVWATWCKPCVAELPHLDSFYVANGQNKKSTLLIYTFSFQSQKLADYMKTKGYHFPVAEIDGATNEAWGIHQYPTKILITPGGHYIQVESLTEWEMYLRNYCMFE